MISSISALLHNVNQVYDEYTDPVLLSVREYPDTRFLGLVTVVYTNIVMVERDDAVLLTLLGIGLATFDIGHGILSHEDWNRINERRISA